jgi:hypothetical protein
MSPVKMQRIEDGGERREPMRFFAILNPPSSILE